MRPHTISLKCGSNICADYPMSSTISAEHNPLGSRGRLVLTVFASLGLGNPAAGIVFPTLLVAFKSVVSTNVDRLEWVWRLLLGVSTPYRRVTRYVERSDLG